MQSVPYVGMTLPEVVRETSSAQLFLFSAATWNPHRIHYDLAYAGTEGYDGVLVQSHLHACFLADAAMSPFGRGAVLRSLSWQNRAPAYAGDTLVVSGEVIAVESLDGALVATIALGERRDGGEVCVRGEATLVVPHNADPDVGEVDEEEGA